MQKLYPDSKNRVAFAYMPWARVDYGSLGLSLIKSMLDKGEIGSDIFYFNMLYSQMVGLKRYRQFTDAIITPEYVFSDYYYGLERDMDHLDKILDMSSAQDQRDNYLHCMDQLDAYFDNCVALADWTQYDVLGISVLFEQRLSSVALAKKVKEVNPDIKVVFGGPGCDGAMGRELLRVFPEVDYVYQGEAEFAIVPFVRSILYNEGKPEDISGVCYLEDGEVKSTGEIKTFFDMDKTEYPDYEDYFYQRDVFECTHNEMTVYLEGSRGCWWGEKKACRFCGLNGLAMKYRSKSQVRFIEEIKYYIEDHDIRNFYFADNILDMKYFEHVLPELIKLRDKYNISFNYEVKSNLKAKHVKELRKAGCIMVQPGVESFNTHVLHLMDKGAKEKHSVQIVKYCAEENVKCDYNILTRFPYEKAEDYQMQIDLLPYIKHLPAPNGMFSLVLTRFSVYHNDPESYEIRKVQPSRWYNEIFRDPEINMTDFVYHFEFEHDCDYDKELVDTRNRLRELIGKWKEDYVENTLVYDLDNDRNVVLFDKRDGSSKCVVLQSPITDVIQQTLAFTKVSKIAQKLPDELGLDTDMVRKIVDQMVEKKWMYISQHDEAFFLPVRRYFYHALKTKKSTVSQHAATVA
ncbi:MAG: RiPP maturation radical SAM C-methyltransferase [Calditrichota bacterium]